jgi:peptide/nickel transport system permease protein
MRNSLLETFGQDYIRTARAKGLSEFQIIRKHALKNSPVVTAISGWFASMLAGAVLLNIFWLEWIRKRNSGSVE